MTVQVPFPRPVETAGVLVDEGQEGQGGGGGQVVPFPRTVAEVTESWQSLRAIKTFT